MKPIDATVIIVGGGPGGASCACRLARSGVDVLLLDKAAFPRNKICAGWITPEAIKKLELRIEDIPGITMIRKITFSILGISIPMPVIQYAIRRKPFDAFLLSRANVPVIKHRVNKIDQKDGFYIIDNKFRCKYLVGAGGTHCPVYKAIFSSIRPRDPRRLIAAVEVETRLSAAKKNCRLWFFSKGLPGYAWFLPKKDGWINIGIGGKAAILRRRKQTILYHWRMFIKYLQQQGYVQDIDVAPKGHLYHLRLPYGRVSHNNAFIVGDAAGLATLDMGEGIGPAVESGIRAADAILGRKPYDIETIGKWSIPHMLLSKVISRTRDM